MPGSLQKTRNIPLQGCIQTQRVPRRGYSLIELLVVMSVVMLLTGLLLPTLASVRDAANRVISKSNQRNIGQAIALFADSQQGDLPQSAALTSTPLDLGDLMRAWTPEQLEIFDPSRKHARWLSRGFDGLGRLFQHQYLKEPSVLYSPGHMGAHRWDEYEKNWHDLNQVMTMRVGNEDINPERTIYTNYHYAGHKYWDPDIDSSQWRDRLFSDGYASILLSDGLRRSSDLNFDGGINVLHMDLSVEWLEDWQLSNVLPPDGENTIGSGGHVIRAMWDIFRPH